MNNLLNISSIDGRYYNITNKLFIYFSEYGLFNYRLIIEINYYILLCKELNINIPEDKLAEIVFNFDLNECIKIKNIENNIKHDVKSLELYIRNKFKELEIPNKNLIHFGLTSQDINNTSISLSIKDYINKMYKQNIIDILSKITILMDNSKNIIMISRTHGQSAVPTTLKKELQVFKYRLSKEFINLCEIKHISKFGGAVGNFNAHYSAYPNIDWNNFGDNFLKSINLERSQYTTQIDNYENLSIIFDNIKRINTILVDFCQDIWYYISIDYFKQKYNKNEVGSSTMPHKINPINFENAEGNLLLSINLFEFLSRKLPISRLQRDLTDSTILRNLGIVFGYCEIAYHNLLIGIGKLEANRDIINNDLNKNTIVLTEGIQTILRKYGDDNAYNKLKEFSRNNKKIDIFDIKTFIQNLDVEENVKNELNNLNIENYIGCLKE